MNKTWLETVDEAKKEAFRIDRMYNSECVNWRGKTKDTGEYYSEIIAEELLNCLKVFEKIQTVTKASYFNKSHCDSRIEVCNSHRDETDIAKRISGLKLPKLGLVLDYRVPVTDTAGRETPDKIDMISFHKKTRTLYLIELKYKKNKDTLLKATLESYTFFKTIDKEKLVSKCFYNHKLIREKGYHTIPAGDIRVKPAVLVIPKCNAYYELEELEWGDRPKLKALAIALNINFFTLELLTKRIPL